MKSSKKLIWIVIFVLGATAFSFWAFQINKKKTPTSWGSREVQVTELESRMRELAAKIQSLQGGGKCEMDSDCKTVGLGAEVCQGFKNFLVYSIMDTDEGALLNAVKELNETSGKLENLSLKSASCGAPAGRAQCIQRRCTVLNP